MAFAAYYVLGNLDRLVEAAVEKVGTQVTGTAVTVDGVSIAPLLRGSDKVDREALYWHYPHYSNQGGFPAGAVRMLTRS